MEAAIKEQFSPAILDEALARFGIDPAGVEPLDGFESFVYRVRLGGKERILRVSHSLHRGARAIAAEIDWVNYLAGDGLTVCEAVPSTNRNLVEVIESETGGDGDHFTAAVFRAAPGRKADEETWQRPIFEAMGRMMGRMHALSTRYEPGGGDPDFERRPQWDEDIPEAEKFLPPGHESVIGKMEALIAETHSLPTSRDSFGLVHIDFHRGNFHVDEQGGIHLFDFDDCQYSWFADDIAMALFYAVPHDCSSPADLEAAGEFLRHFLTGYREENEVDSEWLCRIPQFLKRREMDLYTVVHRSLDLENPDPWTASFMDRRRFKIENEVPYVDLDFSEF